MHIMIFEDEYLTLNKKCTVNLMVISNYVKNLLLFSSHLRQNTKCHFYFLTREFFLEYKTLFFSRNKCVHSKPLTKN